MYHTAAKPLCINVNGREKRIQHPVLVIIKPGQRHIFRHAHTDFPEGLCQSFGDHIVAADNRFRQGIIARHNLVKIFRVIKMIALHIGAHKLLLERNARLFHRCKETDIPVMHRLIRAAVLT